MRIKSAIEKENVSSQKKKKLHLELERMFIL